MLLEIQQMNAEQSRTVSLTRLSSTRPLLSRYSASQATQLLRGVFVPTTVSRSWYLFSSVVLVSELFCFSPHHNTLSSTSLHEGESQTVQRSQLTFKPRVDTHDPVQEVRVLLSKTHCDHVTAIIILTPQLIFWSYRVFTGEISVVDALP